MQSRTQTSEHTQHSTQLARARHARTRERAYAAWYTILIAYGHLPGSQVDVVSGSISPLKKRPGQGPCQVS